VSIAFVVTLIDLLKVVALPNSSSMEEMTTQYNAKCFSQLLELRIRQFVHKGYTSLTWYYHLNFCNFFLFVWNTKAEQISPMEGDLV